MRKEIAPNFSRSGWSLKSGHDTVKRVFSSFDHPRILAELLTKIKGRQGLDKKPRGVMLSYMKEVTDMAEFWYCNVCKAQNHYTDGECQYCDCGGDDCQRDNCADDRHPYSKEESHD